MGRNPPILWLTLHTLFILILAIPAIAQYSECDDSQFRCQNGMCIPKAFLCNRNVDCVHGEDEENCPNKCDQDEKFCKDGVTCVREDQFCDGIKNCPSNEDEDDCSTMIPYLRYYCPNGKFTCKDLSCISIIGRCDGKVDCPNDRADEENCPCLYDRWQCDDGTCIPMSLKCDGNLDCPEDSSDERGCDDHLYLEGDCNWGEFQCNNGQCLPQSAFCNQRYDCSDYSDEANCQKGKCKEGYFQCNNGICLPLKLKCDGFTHCNDKSDEMDCPPSNNTTTTATTAIATTTTTTTATYATTTSADKPKNNYDKFNESAYDVHCLPDGFRCKDGKCIPSVALCDNQIDCTDGEDEQDCKCSHTEYKCLQGRQCIPKEFKCNGRYDCNDGSDELRCNDNTEEHCHANEFQCDDGECIESYKYCNGIVECTDESDEYNCPLNNQPIYDYENSDDAIDTVHMTHCALEEYECGDAICIHYSLRCNGYPDCSDESDERDCPNFEEDCNDDEFSCDGQCHSSDIRCNGVHDCTNLSDEKNCTSCQIGAFHCLNNECIPEQFRCDTFEHCPDGSDEINCVSCTNEQFECDGICMSLDRFCDDEKNCKDGKDEADCTPAIRDQCLDDQWQCHNSQCINSEFLCDNHTDCHDGSDELDNICSEEDNRVVTVDDCSYNEFFCDDTCYSHSIKCDGHFDCLDRKDEENCPEIDSRLPTLSSSYACAELTCPGSGKCFKISEKCDRTRDCDDGFDESDCPCKDNQFSCYDQQLCINATLRCDGYYDCKDFSDEQNCFGCSSNQYRCRDGECINKDLECNGYADCHDGSDESVCHDERNNIPNYDRCGTNRWACDNREQCIWAYERCDGNIQCSDSSDERNCRHSSNGCERENMYRCENGPCIPMQLRCNGHIDCPFDGTDEIDCPIDTGTDQDNDYDYDRERDNNRDREQREREQREREQREREQREREERERELREREQREREQREREQREREERERERDRNRDTDRDHGDHQLNLKTYPKEQTIKASREVVFQCRDEGSLRARVRWSKPFGQSLPATFRDLNGRLEMPNIRVEDSGEYICEAYEYPSHMAGQSVSVFLHVDPYVRDERKPACGEHEATCMDGQCISKSLICNGVKNCVDGSDEHACSLGQGCNPDQFLCNNGRCVEKIWVCDGDNDCDDNSDEQSCDPNPTGAPCRSFEFQCRIGQCIPKSFHCDNTVDCQDGSDEIGCSDPRVIKRPVPRVNLPSGGTLNISCLAAGVPTPLIVWRRNWGHVPRDCVSTSSEGFGTLVCPNMVYEDSGAYSCEIVNIKARVFVTPDTIVTVEPPRDVCLNGFFNMLARRPEDCVNCFCFGVSNQCKSADLFIHELRPPVTRSKVVGIDMPNQRLESARVVDFSEQITPHHGVEFRFSNIPYTREVPYLALPSEYHGNQLKSYGGHIKYDVEFIGNGHTSQVPDIIIIGNGYIFYHEVSTPIQQNIRNSVSVQLVPQNWRAPNGQRARREELMMLLANIENILIRLQYIEGTEREVELIHVTFDSAGINDIGLGPASLVEQCSCPPGYSGLSCEGCASGFVRQRNGLWLGSCVPEEPTPCPPGTYGDVSRGIACMPCSCPLPNPENNFARACSLGSDNDIICHCDRGYTGRRCEMCDEGYEGNPLTGQCTPIPKTRCDPRGTLLIGPQGDCVCKDGVMDIYCDKCRASTFHLNDFSRSGCLQCFCSGATTDCSSSTWYRDTVHARFNNGYNTDSFTLITDYEAEKLASFPIEQRGTELRFQGRSDDTEVYYWSLPKKFLGDIVTAYGGQLNYTIRYNPLPGGSMSKNNAPDVVIKSLNDLVILHHRKTEVSPSSPQTYEIPIIEDAWERYDGRSIDRQNLLMALSDVSAIYIKATYTTVTYEASISHVGLDVATPTNLGTSRAIEVEQCVCPVEYIGLSCEDCAPGYKRADQGLYLGICEPCECNGHSNECEPETGRCLNCRDNTMGENCEECAPGFARGVSSNRPTDCMPTDDQRECHQCDRRGTQQCDNGYCQCKRNVERERCDECRPGTYNLQEDNIEGCTACFCSGVSSTCSQSQYVREQIPLLIWDADIVLADHDGNAVITNGFDKDIGNNEISYTFRDDADMYFWGIQDPKYLGDLLKSYGGYLQFKSTSDGYGSYIPDRDVVLRGNGKTLIWSRPGAYAQSDENVSVRLHESAKWDLVDRLSTYPASHSDFLTVLSNVEQFLIRATHKSPVKNARLWNPILDTSINMANVHNAERANDVEVCTCPPGYIGDICQTCAPYYFRNTTSSECHRCPCAQENTEYCRMEGYNSIKCVCKDNYYGTQCTEYGEVEPPVRPTPPSVTITVRVTSPSIQIVELGETISLECIGTYIVDSIPIQVIWYKINDRLREGITQDRGRLYIPNTIVSDSGVYVCRGEREHETVEEKVTLTVGPRLPKVSITPPYVTVKEFEPVSVLCDAVGSTPLDVKWMKLNSDGPIIREQGLFLQFSSIRKSDEGTYLCRAQNELGTAEGFVQITVQSEARPSPLYILPSETYINEGEEIQLNCTNGHSNNLVYTWTHDGQALISGQYAMIYNNVLIIRSASERDSGRYECSAYDPETGQYSHADTTVTVHIYSIQPSIIPLPPRYTIIQGGELTILCEATGSPTPTIKWTKQHEPFAPNTVQFGNSLTIRDAQPHNRGTYICFAESRPFKILEASTFIDVEPQERPLLEIYPREPQTVHAGEEAVLSCHYIAGIPAPTVNWERRDHKPISTNIRIEYAGTIVFNNITLEDAGEYICRAENIVGSATGTAVLIVHEVPKVRIYPETEDSRLKVTEGDELRLECYGTGYPLPQVSWNETIYQDAPSSIHRGISSSEAIIAIDRVQLSDAKTYTCTASNDAGDDRRHIEVNVERRRGDIVGGDDDNQWRITTYRPPVYYPTSPPVNNYAETYRVNFGDRATLICEFGSPGYKQTEWDRIDGRPLPHGAFFNGSNLIIEDVGYDAAGFYTCSLIDRNGKRPLVTAEIAVVPVPHITISPKMPQIVHSGENVEIYCNATGQQPMNIQWHAENHRQLPPTVRAEGQRLIFTHITPADAGRYYCSATNEYGNATKYAEVLVNRGTQVQHPSGSHNYEVSERDSLDLSCDISFRLEAGSWYNWRRENNILPSHAQVIGDRLILRNISEADGGRYICEIQSPGGVISENFVDVTVKLSIIRPCKENYFKCKSHPHTCILPSGICDGVNDCTDHSDETDGCYFKRWKKDYRPYRDIASTVHPPVYPPIQPPVYPPIQPPVQPIRPSLNVNPAYSQLQAGDSTEVDCSISNGYGNVQWRRSDNRPLSYNIEQYGNKLYLRNVQSEDAGEYLCTHYSYDGQLISVAYRVDIEEEYPLMKDMPAKVEHAEVGDNINLQCGTNRDRDVFKWKRQDGQSLFEIGDNDYILHLMNVKATDAGTYLCTSTINGMAVNWPIILVVTGAIPHFPQAPKSYITYPKLKDAYIKFNFQVSFKPERPNGLILYNGQKKGSGDYIALSLNNGYPEFRYDFGKNATSVTAEEPIEMRKWHTITVNRQRYNGFMTIDNRSPISFSTASSGLDLMENLHLGGVGRWEDIPMTAVANKEGFVGCISQLILQDQIVDLNKDAIFKEGTTSCEPCADEPCKNNGVCLQSQSQVGYSCVCGQGYTGRHCSVEGQSCTPGVCGSGHCEDTEYGMQCYCPLHKAGDKCQHDESITKGELSFKDGSYAAYEKPKTKSVSFAFRMRAASLEDSIILYVAESNRSHGDYAVLLLKDKHLELRLHVMLVGKPLIVRSLNPVPLNKWINVRISRKNGQGFLKVGNDPEVKEKPISHTRNIYLGTFTYIGGYDKRIELNKNIDITRGFDGCVSNLEISEKGIDMINDIQDAANILQCTDENPITGKPQFQDERKYHGNACAQSRCQNGGTCIAYGSIDFVCDCPIGYGGKFCEKIIQLGQSIAFRGNGYLELNRAVLMDSRDEDITNFAFILSTQEQNGLVFWHGQHKGEEYSGGDFMALALVDGIFELSFRLDGEEEVVRLPNRTINQQFQTIIIERRGNEITLKVNELEASGDTRPTPIKRMHLPGHIFIGGAPNLRLFTGSRYTLGFNGCIMTMETEDEKEINLRLHAISAVNVDNCEEEFDDGTEPPVV